MNVGGRVALQCDRGIGRCRMSKVYLGVCDDCVKDCLCFAQTVALECDPPTPPQHCTGVPPSRAVATSNGKKTQKIDKINRKKIIFYLSCPQKIGIIDEYTCKIVYALNDNESLI